MRNAVYEVRISDWSSEVCSSDLPRQFPASAPKHSGPDSSRRRKVKSAEPHKTSRRVGEILRGEGKWLRSLLLCEMLSSPASSWQPSFCSSFSARRATPAAPSAGSSFVVCKLGRQPVGPPFTNAHL